MSYARVRSLDRAKKPPHMVNFGKNTSFYYRTQAHSVQADWNYIVSWNHGYIVIITLNHFSSFSSCHRLAPAGIE